MSINAVEYAKVRDIHMMETSIRADIAKLSSDMQKCTYAIQETANTALRVASDADRKGTAAHDRIDGLQKILLGSLLGVVVTALGASWTMWKILQEIQVLGLK